MKALESIWQKPVYLPYLQPALTDDAIEDAERKIGCELPKALIELLKEQNGGYIRKTLEESLNRQIYGIGPHFPSLTDFDWTDDKEWVSFELDGLVPFDGDGHWFICLDYRSDASCPAVTYVDVECDEQRKIADSFSDYLSKLVLDLDGKFTIQTDKSIEDVAKEIEGVLPIKFEEPDNHAHGYDQYRGRLNAAWVWLSPNLVPNGFVREGADRYEELVKLSEGEARRFPELPETSLLMSFSKEDVQHAAVEALRKHQIDIRPLQEVIL
ncbi:MAG: SMI1/KNR4 family protein [Bacteroidota bacterium]